MAEVIAKNLMPNLKIASMGVAAASGSPASQNACKAVESWGLSLSSHMSKMIDRELLTNAKLVLTMTNAHLAFVKSFCKSKNAFTLAEYVGEMGDILDPFGGDVETYLDCAQKIKSLLSVAAKKLLTQ